eukprot:NODE_75_length_23955_cov_0.435069.p28 type:complete len:105 gc:universal NODE_75_length_23955_cov_0.435069:6201-6515(+)
MKIHLLLNPMPQRLQPKQECQNTHKCNVCYAMFTSQSALARHVKSVHCDPRQCPLCHKHIKYRARIDNLRAHLTRCRVFRAKFQYCDPKFMNQLVHSIQMTLEE